MAHQIEDYYLTTSPTFSQAFRWFRVKYGIIGNVNDNCILENTYSISISKIFDSRILYVNGRNHNLKDKQGFTTYEEAELECLKKLIEIVKQKQKKLWRYLNMTARTQSIEGLIRY